MTKIKDGRTLMFAYLRRVENQLDTRILDSGCATHVPLTTGNFCILVGRQFARLRE